MSGAAREDIYKNMTVVAGGGGHLAQVRPPGSNGGRTVSP